MNKMTRSLLLAFAVVVSVLGTVRPAKAIPLCLAGGPPYSCHCGTQWKCVADATACTQWCNSILP